MIVLVIEDREVHVEGEGRAGYSFPGLLVQGASTELIGQNGVMSGGE